VETFDFGFEGGKLFFDRFDEEQLFATGLDFALPAIDRLNRSKNNRGAGGEAFTDYFASDVTGFAEVSACDQHDPSGFRTRHGFLRNGAGT